MMHMHTSHTFISVAVLFILHTEYGVLFAICNVSFFNAFFSARMYVLSKDGDILMRISKTQWNERYSHNNIIKIIAALATKTEHRIKYW